jgi:BON domain
MKKFLTLIFWSLPFLLVALLLLLAFGPKLITIVPICQENCFGQADSTPAATPGQSIDFGLSDANGKITLTGLVPSEDERQSLLAQADAVYGPGRVIDQLNITPNATLPAWRQSLERALVWLRTNPEFSLHQRGKLITLAGSAPSERIKAEKEAQVRANFGGTHTIDNRIAIGTAFPANQKPGS